MIDLRRTPELWRRLDVTVRDLPFGLILVVGALIPALHNLGTRLGDAPPRPFDALAIGAIALQGFPIAIRRRWPVACLALVSLGFAVDQLRG
ncbi:MAG: two-component sensor histidine kinase, partial [Stackebrandtia sp.]